ncbi:MAG: hypothetical protein QOE76_2750 [Frankiales bacterium]|jgi:hypothetical protein|nr:hypothetical protein [Frankiales bacterium]
MTTTTELKLKILSWDEAPYRELPDGAKFARATVVLGADAGDAAGTFESLLFYRPDGTSRFVCLMQLDNVIEGRSGSFVLEGRGSYDGTTAELVAAVVEGSGTGDLVGVTGTVSSTSTHADYPYMPISLGYELG